MEDYKTYSGGLETPTSYMPDVTVLQVLTRVVFLIVYKETVGFIYLARVIFLIVKKPQRVAYVYSFLQDLNFLLNTTSRTI